MISKDNNETKDLALAYKTMMKIQLKYVREYV